MPTRTFTSFYQDFLRGVERVQKWMRHAPESAFYKLEEIQLRYRLANIQKKLSDAYFILGTQVLDHLTQNAPLMSNEERDHLYKRMRTLREEKKRIEAEMEELQYSSKEPEHENV